MTEYYYCRKCKSLVHNSVVYNRNGEYYHDLINALNTKGERIDVTHVVYPEEG